MRFYVINDWKAILCIFLDPLPLSTLHVQVRISIYKDGRQVVWTDFDGLESNDENWIAKDRIIESSFSDVHIDKLFCKFK